jgi:hypothetical protein
MINTFSLLTILTSLGNKESKCDRGDVIFFQVTTVILRGRTFISDTKHLVNMLLLWWVRYILKTWIIQQP